MTAWPALVRVTLALEIEGDADARVALCPVHHEWSDMRGSDTDGLAYWQCGAEATCTGRQSAVWQLYETLEALQ